MFFKQKEGRKKRNPKTTQKNMLVLRFAFVSLLFGLVSSHVLECYECASMRDGRFEIYEELRKDACFDPIKAKMNATKCPDGTSCYKQETIIMDTKVGEAVMSEKYVAISRYCGSTKFHDGCSKHFGANSVMTTCACTTDECNASVSQYQLQNYPIVLLAISSVAAYFYLHH